MSKLGWGCPLPEAPPCGRTSDSSSSGQWWCQIPAFHAGVLASMLQALPLGACPYHGMRPVMCDAGGPSWAPAAGPPWWVDVHPPASCVRQCGCHLGPRLPAGEHECGRH